MPQKNLDLLLLIGGVKLLHHFVQLGIKLLEFLEGVAHVADDSIEI
ncbi:hypothetical protein IKH79_00520 [Candidatus Saccharibacteria bacterium]|nr:hypothetical protein [Candidatus Saccharibacteria bacterium]